MVTKAGHRSTAGCRIRISWQPATRDVQQRKNISCKEAFDFQSCMKCSQENHVNAHWTGGGEGRISLVTGSPLLFHQKICSSQALPASLRWFSCFVSKPSKHEVSSSFDVNLLWSSFQCDTRQTPRIMKDFSSYRKTAMFSWVCARGKDRFVWSASKYSGAVDTH